MFGGNDLTKYTERQMQAVRGSDSCHDFSWIPMTSLNPTMKVGQQIEEIAQGTQKGYERRAAKDTCSRELLALVGHLQSGSKIQTVSPSALRRYAPARHDRRGACDGTKAFDCG